MPASLAKIRRRMEELAELRYVDRDSIGEVRATRISVGDVAAPGEYTLRVGDRWGERDALYRLQCILRVPPGWRGQTVALYMDLSANDGGGLATVEGLLSIDGQAFHALDRYHREILLMLPTQTKNNWNARSIFGPESMKAPISYRHWNCGFWMQAPTGYTCACANSSTR